MGRMAIYYDAVQIKDNALQHGESPTTPEPPTRARSLARIGSWPAFLYPPDSRKWGRLPSFRRVWVKGQRRYRSEEHTSELQSRLHLVCRLLLEKKKKKYYIRIFLLDYRHRNSKV